MSHLPLGQLPQGRTKTLPICTRESVNYTLECISCKEQGKRRIYWGETSRSGSQRGAEHYREVVNGVQTHPLVLHYIEEHEGQRQPFLMRITDYHQKAQERQIVESLRIEEGGKALEESLNLKSEWAASKLPSISVRKATRAVGRKEEKRV